MVSDDDLSTHTSFSTNLSIFVFIISLKSNIMAGYKRDQSKSNKSIRILTKLMTLQSVTNNLTIYIKEILMFTLNAAFIHTSIDRSCLVIRRYCHWLLPFVLKFMFYHEDCSFLSFAVSHQLSEYILKRFLQ
jgi:hypothetical protein